MDSDECCPTSPLAPGRQQSIVIHFLPHFSLLALRDRLKVTSVVVTHDMRSAYKVADRIAMLYNGKIVEVGTPDQIRNSANPLVQQFIKGEAVGPIQEGLPDRRVLSRWPARGRISFR